MATSKGIHFGNSYVCCLLYADDLVIVADTAEDLQVLLSCLDEWCHTWKLSINIDKLAIMHFRPKRYPRSSPKFLSNGVSLPFVSQYKYLGVILDEHITFKEAAANRSDQATKASGQFKEHFQVYQGMHIRKSLNLLLPRHWTTVLLYGHTHKHIPL